ncbi:MAG: hypothetical protein ACQEUZ_04650 [Pseudomonadota bacterium]
MFCKTLIGLAVGALLASGALAQSITATCKLTNTAENATLYEGACMVTQSESGSNTIFEVKMGDSEPFLFAGQRGNENWMHGAEEVIFTDLPAGGIFRWSNFALAVAE